MKKTLITGVAGFIGMHTAIHLLQSGHIVYGIDNLCKDSNIKLKKERLKKLQKYPKFYFYKGDIRDSKLLNIVLNININIVIDFVGNANIKDSVQNPQKVIASNTAGFVNLLECAKANNVEHIVYASTSAVYGTNEKLPSSETDSTDNMLNMYAVTKRANEMIAYIYSHLEGIRTTGLRLFTVYGNHSRNDLAVYKFVNKILKGETIDVYNNGDMRRDFVHVSDVVNAIDFLIHEETEQGKVPHEIYNVGSCESVSLMELITEIEKALGMEAKKNFLPMNSYEAKDTMCDMKLLNDKGFKSKVNIKDGVQEFVEWFKNHNEKGVY